MGTQPGRSGIISYGVYVPFWRLQREAITVALGSGSGRGSRSVAGYDEDTTSMGVEAARCALGNAPEGCAPSTIAFATSAPAYLDKTNANTIHAALAMPSTVGAVDCVGSARSAAAALMVAEHRGGVAVLSHIPVGLPGGADAHAGARDALHQRPHRSSPRPPAEGLSSRCRRSTRVTPGSLAIAFMTSCSCLLYTSDAADERSRGDLGGRGVI